MGKAALRGRLTADSLEIYFPASREYVSEALAELLATSACPFPLAELNILSLFHNLPDSLSFTGNLHVISNYDKASRPAFVIHAEGCSWQVKLVYDLRKTGWRVREFSFTDGDRISLRGKREKYRASAKIKTRRFEVAPPPEALNTSR